MVNSAIWPWDDLKLRTRILVEHHQRRRVSWIENVWEYLRGNKLAITVFDDYDDIVDKACDAWNFFEQKPHRVNHRPNVGNSQSLGPLVLLGAGGWITDDRIWYQCLRKWGKLGYFNAKGISIPVAVSVFPDEIYTAPRSWAERFPN